MSDPTPVTAPAIDPGLRTMLRIEGAAVAIVALVVFLSTGASAWLLLFCLLPDISIAGYALGSRWGARLYNAAHTYIGPMLLAAVALWQYDGLLPFAALWIIHIGIDRALGYGLKSPTGFAATHLGPIGRNAR